MISHYIETYNDLNWGKFVLLRHDPEDLARKSALPGYTNTYLLAGRKFDGDGTFVLDLQTGEGAVFYFQSPADVQYTLNHKHQIWVCPMYEPFICWLAENYPELQRGGGDITKLPDVVELSMAPQAMSGYRRTRQG